MRKSRAGRVSRRRTASVIATTCPCFTCSGARRSPSESNVILPVAPTITLSLSLEWLLRTRRPHRHPVGPNGIAPHGDRARFTSNKSMTRASAQSFFSRVVVPRVRPNVRRWWRTFEARAESGLSPRRWQPPIPGQTSSSARLPSSTAHKGRRNAANRPLLHGRAGVRVRRHARGRRVRLTRIVRPLKDDAICRRLTRAVRERGRTNECSVRWSSARGAQPGNECAHLPDVV